MRALFPTINCVSHVWCGITVQQSGYGHKGGDSHKTSVHYFIHTGKDCKIITYLICGHKFGAHTREVIIVAIKSTADERLGYEKKL